MKKIFLMGRSEAGKTSLTQALKGEELHYHKTQYTNTNEDTIDSPGEYAESKHFSVGLACFSFEADVIAIVQAANEPFNLFSACVRDVLPASLRPIRKIFFIFYPVLPQLLWILQTSNFNVSWKNRTTSSTAVITSVKPPVRISVPQKRSINPTST